MSSATGEHSVAAFKLSPEMLNILLPDADSALDEMRIEAPDNFSEVTDSLSSIVRDLYECGAASKKFVPIPFSSQQNQFYSMRYSYGFFAFMAQLGFHSDGNRLIPGKVPVREVLLSMDHKITEKHKIKSKRVANVSIAQPILARVRGDFETMIREGKTNVLPANLRAMAAGSIPVGGQLTNKTQCANGQQCIAYFCPNAHPLTRRSLCPTSGLVPPKVCSEPMCRGIHLPGLGPTRCVSTDVGTCKFGADCISYNCVYGHPQRRPLTCWNPECPVNGCGRIHDPKGMHKRERTAIWSGSYAPANNNNNNNNNSNNNSNNNNNNNNNSAAAGAAAGAGASSAAAKPAAFASALSASTANQVLRISNAYNELEATVTTNELRSRASAAGFRSDTAMGGGSAPMLLAAATVEAKVAAQPGEWKRRAALMLQSQGLTLQGLALYLRFDLFMMGVFVRASSSLDDVFALAKQAGFFAPRAHVHNYTAKIARTGVVLAPLSVKLTATALEQFDIIELFPSAAEEVTLAAYRQLMATPGKAPAAGAMTDKETIARITREKFSQKFGIAYGADAVNAADSNSSSNSSSNNNATAGAKQQLGKAGAGAGAGAKKEAAKWSSTPGLHPGDANFTAKGSHDPMSFPGHRGPTDAHLARFTLHDKCDYPDMCKHYRCPAIHSERRPRDCPQGANCFNVRWEASKFIAEYAFCNVLDSVTVFLFCSIIPQLPLTHYHSFCHRFF